MSATDRAIALARAASDAALDKKAEDVIAIDVSGQLALTDIFVIASATNERQVGAIVDEIEERVRRAGAKPLRREGGRDDRWVLIDFGDIVVHVQHQEERAFYQLERLWRDCPLVDVGAAGAVLADDVAPAAAAAAAAATGVAAAAEAPGKR
ncbi:MAG TPA: ribosome silencing factor [Dermatophilaceae bacterium]|nr:ribosome silencing factor [Dermatophilaceae bacterium]